MQGTAWNKKLVVTWCNVTERHQTDGMQVPTDQTVGGSNPSERAGWPEMRAPSKPC
jgi:hypothetical protein